MNAFTQILTEGLQHDSHMAALCNACETPGGYTWPFLNALRDIARDRLQRFAQNPVSTEGEGYLVAHRVRQRIRETARLKGVVREAGILLEGIPIEFEDAAADLSYSLEEDEALERDALQRVRMERTDA